MRLSIEAIEAEFNKVEPPHLRNGMFRRWLTIAVVVDEYISDDGILYPLYPDRYVCGPLTYDKMKEKFSEHGVIQKQESR